MVIKKYTQQQTGPEAQASRLEAYAAQGRSYRATQKARYPGPNTLLKGSLAALIPLAAAGTLNAQCQGGAGEGAINLPIGGHYDLDVDSDGNDDFRF